ncbi:MAG: murein biosynthesis integral membrane protein MurJ [Carbonactinosporaceae bacterium]
MSETASTAAGEPTRGSSLLRSSTVMALGTVVSRVTGFARNLVVVSALGTAIFADTYNVANTVPNILYILLVGGALNSVFVPQLVRAMRSDEDGGQAYANRLMTATAVILLVISAAAVLAAPLIVRLYAGGFTRSGLEAEYDLTVTFARLLLPQIFFYGIFVMLGQVLNARDRFGPMMWTPILNNVVVMAVFGLFIAVAGGADSDGLYAATISPGEVRLLGIGTTLGVVIQALTLYPYVRAAGFRFRPRFDWRGVGLGKAGSLAKWTMAFVLVNQLGYLVIVRLTTSVSGLAAEEGLSYGVGYTPYQNAYLLFMLPHAIVTVSVVTALLPRMSRSAAEGRTAEVRDDVSSGLRLVGVAIVPAAFAFLALGPYLSGVLYAPAGGQSARFIGYVLMGFALGLIPFSAQYLVLRGFYALEDTRTPFLITIWINVVNVALAVACFALLPVVWITVGIAASYTVAYVVGFAISARVLRGRIGGLDFGRVASTYGRLVLASVISGAAAVGVARLCVGYVGGGISGSLLAALAGGVAMIALYLPIAYVLRVAELSALLGMVKGRLGR